MRNHTEIEEVVIVGGGPVGNLCAVLSGLTGVLTTVYQKRQTYTREINLKIETDLFKEISETFQHIARKKDDYFENMHKLLVEKEGKIVLNHLEKSLKDKAQSLGVKYVIGKQIKTFKQVYDAHGKNKPIILDCTGRNSFLRVNEFGTDAQNMKIHDLHHALHINFDAVIPRDFDFRLIYSIITNTDNIQLGDIVMSKNKKEENDVSDKGKSAHVTIPLFISSELSKVFDEHYPNINRVPLRPFSYRKQDTIEQQEVENLLYAIFCPFLMEDWQIDWSSVVIKKINITCGYAKGRSRDRFICLGDSAAHFAYFKSLNFGLKHGFEFMRTLASYYGFRCNLGQFKEQEAIALCKSYYPPLIIKQARPGLAPSQYFIKTKAIIYSAMVFNAAYNSINKLDILPVIAEEKVDKLWEEYAKEQRQLPWQNFLDRFEQIRQKDIDLMILSNRGKKNGTELISYMVWLDGLNPLKFADVLNLTTKGFSLDRKDLEYFSRTFKDLKRCSMDQNKFKTELIKCTEQIEQAVSSSIPKNFHQFCNEIKTLSTNDKFTMQQFAEYVSFLKWERANYDYKRGTIYLKTLKLVGTILEMSMKETGKSKPVQSKE